MNQHRFASGPRSLASILPRLAKPAFKRRGFAQGDVITRWPDIVGELLARVSWPERLQFPQGNGPASLQVRVASGFAPELQHLSELVLERINTFYGYRAVGRLKIVQGPLRAPRPAAAPPRRPVTPVDDKKIAQALTGIEDDELKEALARFGRELAARRG